MSHKDREISPEEVKARAFSFPDLVLASSESNEKVPVSPEDRARYQLTSDGTLTDSIFANFAAVQVEMTERGRVKGITIFENVHPSSLNIKQDRKILRTQLAPQNDGWQSIPENSSEPFVHIGAGSPIGQRFAEIVDAQKLYWQEWQNSGAEMPFSVWKMLKVADELTDSQQVDRPVIDADHYQVPEQLLAGNDVFEDQPAA